MELEKVKERLMENPSRVQLKEFLGFPFLDSESVFLQDYDNNVRQLISMIQELQDWVLEKIKLETYLSVLGM